MEGTKETGMFTWLTLLFSQVGRWFHQHSRAGLQQSVCKLRQQEVRSAGNPVGVRQACGWQKNEGALGFRQQLSNLLPSKSTRADSPAHRLPSAGATLMGYISQGQRAAAPHESVCGSCRLGEKLFTLGQVSRTARCYGRMLRAYSPGLEMETILDIPLIFWNVFQA